MMRPLERIALSGMAMMVAIVFIIMNPMMPTHRFYINDEPNFGTIPKSAQEFSAGVCVNAHWYFGSTPYTDSYATLKTALQDLHITCVRDQWYPGSTTQKDRFVDLADETPAIKHAVIMDPTVFDADAAARTAADADSSGAVSTAEAIDHLLDNAPGSVLTLEGPNEMLGSNCALAISTAQEIWAVKQTDSRLADVPILAPSAADPTENACLGDLSAYTDEGNIHSYPGAANPEAEANGSNWSLAGWKTHASGVVGGAGAPLTATETGYHNAVSTSSGHLPVSETADGKYMAQLFFAYQRANVHRVYKYELVDQQSEPANTNIQYHFGYLRNNLTQKPSYVAVNNIMDLLADSGTTNLTRLNYTLSTGTGTVKSYLLQKTDGSWWLAVWNDVDVWSTGTGDLSPADVSVTLGVLNSKTFNVYRPYVSASVQSTSTGTSKVLSVGVDPLLVKIS